MAFTDNDVRANRDYFARKLQAEKARSDVVHAAEAGKLDFVLLDTRGREPFVAGHIPGAWCFPATDAKELASQLPRDREIVTYCWGHD